MKILRQIMLSLFLLVMVFGFTAFAHATLNDNLDGTVTQTRDDGSMLMWLQDVKDAQTSGYDADGLMTWAEATIWIDTLNTSNYLGYDDWRLPETLPVNEVSFDYTWNVDGSSDTGYNISASESAYPGTTASELSYMYYVELGNIGRSDVLGNVQPGYGFNNTGSFINLGDDYLWSSQDTSNINKAFHFYGYFGFQDTYYKDSEYYVWAVRTVPETPPIVPEPISAMLFIIGGVTMGFASFRKKTKNSL